MDVLELLRRTTAWFQQVGIPSARLDAEVLLAHTLGLDRLRLYTSFDRPLTAVEVDTFRERVRRRGRHEPIAYIVGEREFFSRPFAVDSRVLIPRPETEELVESVIARLPPPEDSPLVVLDWGAGSGVIAATLLLERPDLRALAVDLSKDALAVARANAERHGVADRVGFVHGSGFDRVPDRFVGTLAAIVANPPYVAESERAAMRRDVLDWEPEGALFPGPDSVFWYRRIAADAPRWLRPGGLLAFEIGHTQGAAVASLCEAAGLTGAQVCKDLAGLDRFVFAVRPKDQAAP